MSREEQKNEQKNTSRCAKKQITTTIRSMELIERRLKMKKVERIKMVKAMEYIARQVNDEEVFMGWLMVGVADGDIRYGDLSVEDDDSAEYYTEDKNFSELMTTFLRLMSEAYKSGGLYCDRVVSKDAKH